MDYFHGALQVAGTVEVMAMNDNRRFVLVTRSGAWGFFGTEQQIEDDLYLYFDSIEERSVGVVPAEAPLKRED